MHKSKDTIPVRMELPGATLRTAQWGGMTVAYAKYAKGTDLTPALKGLKNDMCQCPHWGYIISGALHLRFAEGRVEILKAGDLWYAEPGHTAWCEEDTEFIDFSPQEAFAEVIEHVQNQLQA
jgi:hypothetical protein